MIDEESRGKIDYWYCVVTRSNFLMLHRWFFSVLTTVLIVLVVACSSPTPPTEFAPGGEIVSKAIALQLNQNSQRLSEQLNATSPQLEISQIAVKKLESILVENLPTYHLQGTYTLQLLLPRQKISQNQNKFDVYLQRQIQGQTWRLLRRDVRGTSEEIQWTSYLIE